MAGLVLLLATLVSCTGAGLRKATPALEARTLRVGTQPYLSNTVIQIGVEEGYFAAQGLTIELVAAKGSAELLSLLATGAIDAGTPAFNPGLLNAVAAGSKMRIALPLTVHATQECTTVAIMARKDDVDSGRFGDPADWKGVRVIVGTSGLQGTNGYFLSRALALGGLNLTDIEAEKAEAAIHEEALRSGQVDLAVVLEPWVTRMLASGDIGVVMPIEPLVDNLQSSAVVYSESLMADPDAAQRFATAYMQALRQYAQGATPRNVEIAAAFTGLDAELLADVCWSYVPTDGHIDAESLARYQEWLLAEGLIDRLVAADEYIDTRYVEEAVRQLDGSAR